MSAEVEVVQDGDGRWRWVVAVGPYRSAPSTDAYDDPKAALQAASPLDFNVAAEAGRG